MSSTANSSAIQASVGERGRKFHLRPPRHLSLYLMMTPAIIVALIYSYGPMVGLLMAFENFTPYQGIIGSQWVGLQNFQFALMQPDLPQVVFNTVSIAVMKMIAGFIAPLVFALFLNEVRNIVFKRITQTVVYLPHFLSWVIMGAIFVEILSPTTGVVNELLGVFGIKPIFFLGDNNWFPSVLVVSNTWKEFGFNTIVYLAALTGVDSGQYEAAAIDGAGRIRLLWHVTLPAIRPMIILLATLSLQNVFNAGFDQIYNLYNPLVYPSGDIIDTYVYRAGLLQAQYSFATAIGLFKSVVSLICMATSYYLAVRFAKYRIF